jgi:hypothetical protein
MYCYKTLANLHESENKLIEMSKYPKQSRKRRNTALEKSVFQSHCCLAQFHLEYVKISPLILIFGLLPGVLCLFSDVSEHPFGGVIVWAM